MPENNILSDETGHYSLTLWSSNVEYVSDKISNGKKHFLFKGIRVRSFLSPPKTVTTIASSEIFYPDECPAELLNVQPDDVPPDSLETIHAERIMLVSEYTEHASYLNCKRKISDDSVTDSADLKCPVCGTSQLLTDCQRKVNVKVKLQLDSPWLTFFSMCGNHTSHYYMD